jgi:site-specific DNA recombinase
VRATWLEDLVWTDVRRFLENPGEVLERVREQLGSEDNTAELEARRDELAKRLAARQAEKDRYIRTYAQGHISEEELDVYLAELKNQIDNLRLLLESVEGDLSDKRKRTALTDTTHAWLLSLRRRVAEVEEDTEEAFRERRQLVKLLVDAISVGKRQEDGRAEIQITYRFDPPPSSGVPEEGPSVAPFKNGSRS